MFLRQYQDELKSMRHLARTAMRENLSGMQHPGLEEGKWLAGMEGFHWASETPARRAEEQNQEDIVQGGNSLVS